MSLIILGILTLALIVTNGVVGYIYFTLKERKIEKRGNEKRAPLSDTEQEAIQEIRSRRDKLMKATLLGFIGMVIFLILNLGNK